MPLERQVISWPLTGGIDTKTAPLMIQPGSHITLDNVRQERTNEWKRRNGTSNNATADAVPGGPPVRVQVLPGGGIVAITRPTGVGSAVATYAPSLSSSASRWKVQDPAYGAAQSTPSCWSRRAASRSRDGQLGAPIQTSFAVGANGLDMLAWFSSTAAGAKIDTRLISRADGSIRRADLLLSGAGPARRPRAVYCAGRLAVIWAESGEIRIATWNSTDGSFITTTAGTLLKSDAHATQPWTDAIVYGSSTTITFVYRTTGDQIGYLEIEPVARTLTTNVTIAVDCSNALALFPDPDSSGTRFIGTGRVNDVTVLRVNSAGTVLTNDIARTPFTAAQIAGCAYQAGAGWMVLYGATAGNNTVRATKKRTGVIGAETILSSGANQAKFSLESGCWREAGTDLCRVVVGFHGASNDPQDTYYELAIPFEDGNSATNIGLFSEFQARLMPLNAGPERFTGASYATSTLQQVVRVSADKFATAMTRLATFSKAGATANNRYVIDTWTVDYLNTSNITTLNQGAGTVAKDASFIPAGNLLQAVNGEIICSLGASLIPTIPVLTPAAGGSLTLLSKYQYVVREIMTDESGNEWRGPLTTPAIVTLTGTQNQVTVDVASSTTETPFRVRTYEFFRTKADGSVFQKCGTVSGYAKDTGTAQLIDTMSDATLASGDFLSAEVPTSLTPAASHVELFGGRLWLVDRDFPTQLWFSKPILPGRLPEFVGAFQLSLLDSEGDITRLAALDDKLVVFKASAIYVIQGDGPDNAGGGQMPSVILIDSDVGSIVGSPVVSTGQEVYFVSARGIYMMDRSLQVQFIGAPVDQFLNQPEIQTRETVVGAVFSPATNEVRFQTTNYRLVYDRLRGIWYRDTGAGMQNVVSTCMVGSKQALFKSDGTMWIEGDENTSGDNSVSFTGKIRSAWVRPSGMEGRLRLYMARVVMVRTAGGDAIDPVFRIYYDNDDSIVESFPNTAVDSLATAIGASVQPRRHRCRSFSLEIEIPLVDDSSALARLRLEAWGAEVGLRSGAFRNPAADRWT